MRIAIVEDISAEAEKLYKILKDFSEERCLLFEISRFSSGEALLNTFVSGCFDVIFMDIYMDGMTGIEAAKLIRKQDNRCVVIFITTSIEYMPDAFACHAFEYIQKPVSAERTAQAMSDLLELVPQKMQYIEFTSSRQTVRILYSDIVSAVASEHYLDISDISGNVYKSRQTFSQLIKFLQTDKRFLQINKGILVNMDYIVSIEDNICTMKTGQSLPVKIREGVKIKDRWYQYSFEKIRTNQSRGGVIHH